MTLEDFFTLTEMKDGLIAPSRVQELVFVMQKEKDCEIKNGGHTTRQWAAVASTIAATENKDCLDLFIQLDGLCFINRWLNDAQNFGVYANDSIVEESITAMLRAIEKLHLDGRSRFHQDTVCNLLDHHSAKVQATARVLFDSWKEGGNHDAESHDVELAKVDNASDKVVTEDSQPSAVNEVGNNNDDASGLIGGEKSLLRSSDNLPIQGSDNVLQSSVSLECEDVKKGLANRPASVLFEGQPDVVQEQEQNVNGPPENLGAPEICSVSSKLEPEPVSMDASEAKAPESVKKLAFKQNVENNEDDVCSNALQDTSVRDSNLGKTEVLHKSISGTQYVRATNDGKGHIYTDGKGTSKGSDNELDCGIVDALEVVRQVAQEVKRDVCTSSLERISEGRIRQPGSPASVRKEEELTPVPTKEVSSRQSHSTGAHSEERHASISDNTETKPECRPDMVSLPAPILGLPGAPLQFVGTLGWKGSAATSAFRPALPCKNCDSERNLFVDQNCESERNLSVYQNCDTSKQRQDWLDIDLNVAEGEEGNLKSVAESSGLPSGQSSGELSPKRPSRIELDLNSTGEDGDAQPSDNRIEGQLFLGRNGCWSPSPASTGKPPHIINAYGHSRLSDAPVISILGAKVEVGKKDHVPQTLSLSNGKAIEPAIDLTMSRPGGVLGIGPAASFNHSPVFGYNGEASAAPALSFTSARYVSSGTIPFMVDSRGAPVVPQVGASSSTVLSSYSQPPIIMNVNGATRRCLHSQMFKVRINETADIG
ncbi:hypothetical protein VNO77_21618 [Canavalia gladiata]|uniref:TFIIS N-terminal domain-containing protein n=1 Tax=Canavalia gladiata TaxID=3824 RepID=A0AAN9LSF3_CANGL